MAPPPPPPFPNNIFAALITSEVQPSGSGESCPTRTEYFIKGTEPKSPEGGRQKVFIDKATGDLAKEGQTENVEEKEEVIITDPTGNLRHYLLREPEEVVETYGRKVFIVEPQDQAALVAELQALTIH